jgi:hypothetical protein
MPSRHRNRPPIDQRCAISASVRVMGSAQACPQSTVSPRTYPPIEFQILGIVITGVLASES